MCNSDDAVIAFLLAVFLGTLATILFYHIGKDNGTRSEQEKWMKAARKGKARLVKREHTLTHRFTVVQVGEPASVPETDAADDA